MSNITWIEVVENENGIERVGIENYEDFLGIGNLVGINGFVIGDRVVYNGKMLVIVKVSRLGCVTLSDSNNSTYLERARTSEIKKVEGDMDE